MDATPNSECGNTRDKCRFRAIHAGIVLAALAFLPGCTTLAPVTPAADPPAVAIEDVIRQVQQALTHAQTTLATRELPPLKKVTLALQTVAVRKGGLTLKLLVIGAGATWEKDRTQQMTLTLVPPPPVKSLLAASAPITDDLESAIISAAEGVKNANTGPVPLKLDRLDVEISFTVKGSLGASGSSIEITPVTADFNGTLAKTVVQTLTVSFSAP
jgi:hypothetical protein